LTLFTQKKKMHKKPQKGTREEEKNYSRSTKKRNHFPVYINLLAGRRALTQENKKWRGDLQRETKEEGKKIYDSRAIKRNGSGPLNVKADSASRGIKGGKRLMETEN